jgi:hypothetical protein
MLALSFSDHLYPWVCTGEWEADKMHGQGTYTYPSGDVYKGGFEAGLKQGSGTYVFKVSQSALYLTHGWTVVGRCFSMIPQPEA